MSLSVSKCHGAMRSVSERAVTVIHPGTVPRVLKHVFRDEIGNPQPIAGATGYKYFAKPVGLDSLFRKQLQKNQASLGSVCSFLARGPSQGSHECTIGPEAFIAHRDLRDAAANSNMAEAYAKFHYRFPNGFESTQYWKAHHLRGRSSAKQMPGHVDIKTGMCLFSSPTLTVSPGHMRDTTHVPQLPNVPVPTLYELETICRNVSAIADLVGLLRKNDTKDLTLGIYLDIPDFQYYWSACQLLQQRRVSVDYVQNWIRIIDARKRQLARAFTFAMRSALQDRGLAEEAVSVDSGSTSLAVLVKRLISSGKVPCLDELLEEMARNDTMSTWRTFHGALEEPNRPSTVAELGRLLYVYNIVRDANSTGRSIDKRPVIQVDDASEWRIFGCAKSHLKRHPQNVADFIGLFTFPKLIAAGVGRSELYHKYFGEFSDGYSTTAFEAIACAYGSRAAARLQQFYDNERQH